MAASLNECSADKQAYSAADPNSTTQPNRGALCHGESNKKKRKQMTNSKQHLQSSQAKKKVAARQAALCGVLSITVITAGQGHP